MTDFYHVFKNIKIKKILFFNSILLFKPKEKKLNQFI